MNDRLWLNLKALRPKSFGFFLLKGLGCRSIGCQSILTTSKPSSNWIDSPIIRFLPHYTPSIGRPILTGETATQSVLQHDFVKTSRVVRYSEVLISSPVLLRVLGVLGKLREEKP